MSSTLPTESSEALQDLIHLDESLFASFVAALSAAKPILSSRKFSELIGSNFERPDQEKIKRIVREVLIMAETRDDLEGTPEEIADVVASVARDGRSKEFPFSTDDERVLRERIITIFNTAPNLALITKAQDVLTEHQHVFYSARIFTDVRPVFSESGATIDGVGLIHNLNIHFGEGTDHKDFYVALDTGDVQALRAVLDRADAKAKALQALIQQTKVSYME